MPHLLRLPEVIELLSISKPTIYRMIQAGQFPRPLRLGARASRWREDEIAQWIATRERGGSEAQDAA